MARRVPDHTFGAVCKSCKRNFMLSGSRMGRSGLAGVPTEQNYNSDGMRTGLSDVMTFPRGDMSVVSITCGHCNTRNDYEYDDLLVPESELEDAERDEELANLRDEVKELTEKTKALQAQKEVWDKQLSDLVGAYMTLADFVHKRAGEEQAQGNDMNYEGPKT